MDEIDSRPKRTFLIQVYMIYNHNKKEDIIVILVIMYIDSAHQNMETC